MNATMTDAELTALYRREPEHISITDTAKIIRRELKAAFPGVKFSVRSHVYSMGCNINISYVDGPPTKAVEAITDQFCGTGFDGMTDSTTHHDSDWNGKRVHFAGSRPSVSRKITEHATIMGRIQELLADYFRDERPSYHSYDWQILGSMDLRWETADRAFAKFRAERAR